MKLWALLIGALAIAGCGDAGGEEDLFGAKVCVPGATAECACPGGAKGAQACLRDGTGYGSCECGGDAGAGGSGGATGGAGGTGGANAGSGGAGGSCTPRMMCPENQCGDIADGCGGTLKCGCEFGDCIRGACECVRTPEFDRQCVVTYSKPTAMSCLPDRIGTIPNCKYAAGGNGFPNNTVCCAH
jgi:hypothetical protein